MELANVQKLADELIELRCGRHSVGNFYEFLLKAYGDANRAKADFIRFLSGDLPSRMLEAAAERISEEQAHEVEAGSYSGQVVTTSVDAPVVTRALMNGIYEREVEQG
jgi:hypothetical protein